MSHGPSSGGAVKAEPNLVPLLDVVMQLIMFFMLTVNFVQTDQINESIKLPTGHTAVPLDKTVKEVLFLNMTYDGKLLLTNENRSLDTRTKQGRAQIAAYLRKQKESAGRRVGGPKSEEADKIIVILRADQIAKYQDVFQLLTLCEQVGYRRWQLRVNSEA
jgi:biopolymer transport protein ExbD